VTGNTISAERLKILRIQAENKGYHPVQLKNWLKFGHKVPEEAIMVQIAPGELKFLLDKAENKE